MKEKILYLYCLANKMPGLTKSETPEDGLYCINHEGLSVAVTKVGESEFGEMNLKRNLTDPEWIKSKVLIHENVIERIMQSSAVLPFKFPTLFKTEENLKSFLEEHRDKFIKNLRYLKGKEEWGVKIYCDWDKLKRTLAKDGFRDIDQEISASASGRAFLLKKKKDELVNEAVYKKLGELSQACFERLSKHSFQWRINKLLPKELTEKKEEMILNSVFLIVKSKVKQFIHTVHELRTEHTPGGLLFDCTGPWPPYNFA